MNKEITIFHRAQLTDGAWTNWKESPSFTILDKKIILEYLAEIYERDSYANIEYTLVEKINTITRIWADADE